MKTNKLTLQNLNVKSFVTNTAKESIKGGSEAVDTIWNIDSLVAADTIFNADTIFGEVRPRDTVIANSRP